MTGCKQIHHAVAVAIIAVLAAACEDSQLPFASSPDVRSDHVPAAIGGRIAFTHGIYGFSSDIAIMNPDGTGFTNLTNSPEPEVMGGWSPDGTRIIFARGVSNAQFDIWTMNADGTDQQLVLGGPGARAAPVYSPDGTRIAYTQSATIQDQGVLTDIYVANADGTGATNITNSPFVDACARWSPDGSRILFSSTRAGGGLGLDPGYNLFLMDPDGSNVVQLTSEPGLELCPSWSPDGQTIAYGHFANERPGIYLMSADGSDKTRIYALPGGAYSAQPWWSPDARWLAFQRFAGGALNLFRIRTDGSDLFQLTSAHDPTSMSLNPIWSP